VGIAKTSLDCTSPSAPLTVESRRDRLDLPRVSWRGVHRSGPAPRLPSPPSAPTERLEPRCASGHGHAGLGVVKPGRLAIRRLMPQSGYGRHTGATACHAAGAEVFASKFIRSSACLSLRDGEGRSSARPSAAGRPVWFNLRRLGARGGGGGGRGGGGGGGGGGPRGGGGGVFSCSPLIGGGGTGAFGVVHACFWSAVVRRHFVCLRDARRAGCWWRATVGEVAIVVAVSPC